ncbi:MAG: glycoside hydrolase family 13 protein [Lachnospiraceae bacterium]|nr:glycoside hydrolase family 13 protein [Lachnospiraceae bacterium]
MNKSAILHIPMSQYAYGVDEEHVTIRLRTQHNDIETCTLYFGDRACRQTPVIFTEQKMEKVLECERYDYFEATLEKPYKRLNYYFKLQDQNETWLYYGDCFCKETVDDRSEYFQLPFNHRADIVSPPDWAKDAIIYNIFPDSFATGKNHISQKELSLDYQGQEVKGKLGGTIRGITENVDYLVELGVNAIYINPIFAAGEYHKYDLLDYYHIDPCFGTDEDFKELVKVYHENGIRVIIDGVFNHCGWKFFAFEDVVQKGPDSKYADWFYGLNFPVVRPDDWETYPNYECFGYERMMPKLNLSNPEAEEYFCNVGKYWVREFDTDGWRLDVASEINDDFWRRFNREVKSVKKDAILIGEVWETANHWLDGKIFDSAMNYDFRKHSKRFFAEHSIDAKEFANRVADMYMRYRKQTTFAQLNVLDTHDVSRFLSVCHENRETYRLAVVFQMTFPGMPSIFYGDEQGITGIAENDYRSPMPWDQRNEEMFSMYQELIALRHKEELLRRGDFRIIQSAYKDVFAFERYKGNHAIRVIINMSEEDIEISPDSNDVQVLYQAGYENGKIKSKGCLILKH